MKLIPAADRITSRETLEHQSKGGTLGKSASVLPFHPEKSLASIYISALIGMTELEAGICLFSRPPRRVIPPHSLS